MKQLSLPPYNNRKAIGQEDIVHAALRVIYKAPVSCAVEDSKYLNCIAYHEAGHTVVSEILQAGTVNLVSIQKYDSSKGGITSYSKDGDCCHSLEHVENNIVTLLAGKASNEIVFGEKDMGCTNDISKAVEILHRIITSYCSYGLDYFVFRSFPTDDEGIYHMMASKMNEFYDKAKKILIENRNFLDAVAEGLMSKKTLTYHDIAKIRESIKVA